MKVQYGLSYEMVQALGNAVTAAAKQHKLATAAVYIPVSPYPLTVSLVQHPATHCSGLGFRVRSQSWASCQASSWRVGGLSHSRGLSHG